MSVLRREDAARRDQHARGQDLHRVRGQSAQAQVGQAGIIDACMWTGACMMSLSTPAGGDRQRSDGESESVEVSTPQHYRMSQPKPVVVHPACRNAPPLRRAVAKQSGWKPSYRSPKPTELDTSSDERSCPCPNGRQQSDEDCLHMSEDRSQMKNACKLQTEVRRCLPAHVGRRNSDDVCLCDTQARLENVLLQAQGAYGETTPFPRRATR